MRTEKEMMNLIMNKAIHDERIRAVALDGSRAAKSATHDKYCDFDIVYIVTDIREFTKDPSWINTFGEILIVQCPADWYSHPYDYSSHENYNYLIQFTDGNRIDLTLIEVSHITNERNNIEPRIVLLNKDNFKELNAVSDESIYFIKKPGALEFFNTCNEFRWLSLYISKGLCRHELYYAKYAYDVLIMEMFLKMLNWKVAVERNFTVSTGDHSKYLKRYLSEEEMKRFHSVFPDGQYEDIWDKLFLLYDYFADLESYVAAELDYSTNKEETRSVREFLERRKKEK